jgi:hypothetical protein
MAGLKTKAAVGRHSLASEFGEASKKEARMRKAAGILMILYGLKTIGFVVAYLIGGWAFLPIGFGWYQYPLWMHLIPIISAVFIITGGVSCLKKKYWKICFASSICLLIYIMLVEFWYRFPNTYVNIPLSILCGILPLIFICLRKSEWLESQA